MATRRNDTRNTRRYRTNGSAAYQPEYEQEPVRRERSSAAPARRPEPRRRPQTRPRRRPAVRLNIEVREQGAVAPFTVVGLFVVLACALLLVVNTSRLAVANNDIVELRDQLSDLQDENRNLQAKYELMFDLEAIEKQLLADGSMIRPGAGQTVYLDLSAPDSVVYYDGAGTGLSALLQRAEDYLANLLS